MSDDVTITETTVDTFGSTDAGCANVFEREIDMPDGQTRRVMSGLICPFDTEEDVLVWPGHRVRIGGHEWVCEGIEKQPGELAEITLRRL